MGGSLSLCCPSAGLMWVQHSTGRLSRTGPWRQCQAGVVWSRALALPHPWTVCGTPKKNEIGKVELVAEVTAFRGPVVPTPFVSHGGQWQELVVGAVGWGNQLRHSSSYDEGTGRSMGVLSEVDHIGT